MRYRLSTTAQSDIASIMRWTHARFGAAARLRYERLIVMALRDIAADPDRPGSIARPELGDGTRSWHLRGSRKRAGQADNLVQRPRHSLIYRQVDPDTVTVGRILHDMMELESHMDGGRDWL